MGATFGVLEYLSQPNHNADCVNPEVRYKFCDDLTVLEMINILTVGLPSFNVRSQVPSDLPAHGQFVPSDNLKSQYFLIP